jgi:response regulator of citrate/malate metabolism
VIGVLVVDDDFRVAELHARFVRAVPGFEVLEKAHTAAEAVAAAAALLPQLVLLDLYLPDRSGLDIVGELGSDVIMLTAANDAASVRAALGHGVVNYLLKPFGARDLAERLAAYAGFHRAMSGRRTMEQADVDRAALLLRAGDRLTGAIPKGRSTHTATLVVDVLREAGVPLSAADVAARLGVSRATAQRYLSDLVDAGRVRMSLRYGSTGRPEHRYAWRSS